MSPSLQQALAHLRELVCAGELPKTAETDLRPKTRPKVNAHVHLPPNFSAFQTVAEAVQGAARQGVGVLGASNYYDFSAYAELIEQACKHGVFPLLGVEIIGMIPDLAEAGLKINDPANPGKMYLCGKGITRLDPMTPEARRLMGIIRRNDSQRMARMITRMAELFEAGGLPTGLDPDRVIDRVVQRHGCPRSAVCLQERHLAQAFQEALFDRVPPPQRPARLAEILGVDPGGNLEDPVAVQNRIRSRLMKAGKPAFVAERFIGFDDSYRLICELGGIPCYPVLADGAGPISDFESPVDRLIANLKAKRIYGTEFIPLRNQPSVLTEYVTAMREAGLIITAGTEHNTLEMPPIEPTCAGGAPIPDRIKDIFWEGACVVAAHQFLTSRGERGFVDEVGRLGDGYKDDEARIEAFRKLGETVVMCYGLSSLS